MNTLATTTPPAPQPSAPVVMAPRLVRNATTEPAWVRVVLIAAALPIAPIADTLYAGAGETPPNPVPPGVQQ